MVTALWQAVRAVLTAVGALALVLGALRMIGGDIVPRAPPLPPVASTASAESQKPADDPAKSAPPPAVAAKAPATGYKLADAGILKPAMAKLINSPAGKRWHQVTINTAQYKGAGYLGSYDLTLVYESNVLVSEGEAEADTKIVARAALRALIKAGRTPTKDVFHMMVWARQPAKGETGAELDRRLGYATYNFATDSLSYKPPSGGFADWLLH